MTRQDRICITAGMIIAALPVAVAVVCAALQLTIQTIH